MRIGKQSVLYYQFFYVQVSFWIITSQFDLDPQEDFYQDFLVQENPVNLYQV